MKKIGYYLLLTTFLFSLSSCFEDIDNWNSEVFDYSGKFVFKLMSEDGSETYVDYGPELMIYNTADNLSDVIWVDDGADVFPLKNKFQIVGDASSFKSLNDDFDKVDFNIYSIEELPESDPESEGQTITEPRDYIKAVILDGKILPMAATSPGGNSADSLYIKIKLYSGEATYTSKKLPEASWADPAVPEYAWGFTSASHDADSDETYVIAGYRYTGMPEDM